MADAKATFRLEGEDATQSAFVSALGNVREFSEKAENFLKGAFLGGAIAEGIRLMSEGVKSMAEFGDSIEKGADRAGIAVETFSKMAEAFAVADVSAEGLSKGLKNMEVSIAKAADGNKVLEKAFWDLGLSADSLKKLAPEVQLEAIAEALRNVSDPTDRARLGTELLQRQYLELVPILDKGAGAIHKMTEAAQGLSGETTERLAKFNEEMNKVGATLKNFAAYAVGGVGFGFQWLHDIFSPDLATRIKNVQEAIAANEGTGNRFLPIWRAQLAQLQEQADKLTKGPDVTAALAEQGKGRLQGIAAMVKEIDDTIGHWEEELHNKRMAFLKAEDDATKTSFDKRIDFEKKIQDLVSAGVISKGEGFVRSDAAQTNRDLQEFYRTNDEETKQAAEDSLKHLTDQYRGVSDQSKLTTDEMTEYAQQASRNMQSAFEQFLFDPFKGGVKGMLTGFIDALRQMVAQGAASGIFKLLGFDTGGSKTKGDGGILGGLLGGLMDDIPGHASGGSWQVGGSGGTDSQIVAFRASPQERVTVTNPGQSMGGGSVNVTVDLRGAFVDSKQALAAAVQQGAAAGVSRMTQLIKRGAFT